MGAGAAATAPRRNLDRPGTRTHHVRRACADWLAARQGTVKRRTFESDESAWRRYIQPRFGRREVLSVTSAEVSMWMPELSPEGWP